MKEIYFPFLKGLRQLMDFVDDQNFTAGDAQGGKLLSQIIHKFLPIPDRSHWIIVNPAKNKRFPF
jgi:hypothetical protein